METPGSSSSHVSLSVAVITLNEADRIRGLLDSVGIADEVVVIDSGSSDETVEICRDAGATVVVTEWRGYARQKQFAVEQARGEWILSLDADEALSQGLAEEIPSALAAAGNDVSGFSMPRLSRYLGRWIRHGGWYPDRKVRLVRRGCGQWVGEGIHEKLEVSGKVVPLETPILHYVYRDIADQVAVINRFSEIAATHARNKGSFLDLLWGVVHAAGKFLECAVWKLGILDGAAGLVIAVNSSFYVFLKHAKAWEKGLTDEDQALSP
jgi:glycosyltransferase involved in cell wall biosynthesis